MSLSKEDLAKADALNAASKPDASLRDIWKGATALVKAAVDKVVPDDPNERADREAKAYIAASNTASKVGYTIKRTVSPIVGIARGAVKGAFSALKSAVLDRPSPEGAAAIENARKSANTVEQPASEAK